MATATTTRGVRRLRAIALCALLSPSSFGCSYVFVTEAPREHRRMRYFDCTTSRVAPAIDAAAAGLWTLGAAAAVVDPDPWDESTDTAAEVGTALALALVSVLSSVDGFSETSRCREARAELRERLAAEPAVERASMRGCTNDLECKGARICEHGRCVEPPPPPQAAQPSPLPAQPAGVGEGGAAAAVAPSASASEAAPAVPDARAKDPPTASSDEGVSPPPAVE